MPTAMSLRSQKTIRRSRRSMDRRVVLTHDPVKQAPPQKPALREGSRSTVSSDRLFLQRREHFTGSFLGKGLHQVGPRHPGPALFAENLESRYPVGAALADMYSKQRSGIALFGRCQGVPDVFGGGPKGVCLNPEPGIQCAVILL